MKGFTEGSSEQSMCRALSVVSEQSEPNITRGAKIKYLCQTIESKRSWNHNPSIVQQANHVFRSSSVSEISTGLKSRLGSVELMRWSIMGVGGVGALHNRLLPTHDFSAVQNPETMTRNHRQSKQIHANKKLYSCATFHFMGLNPVSITGVNDQCSEESMKRARGSSSWKEPNPFDESPSRKCEHPQQSVSRQ